MVGIIITGHCNFATGIASAVKLVAGQQKNLEAVDFLDTYSTEELKTSSKNIKIISGTNLGMLIENVMMRDMDINFDELVETAISTGKQQVLKFEMCRETEADQQGI